MPPHDDGPAYPLDLPEYRPGGTAVLTDIERWPTLDSAGLAELTRWRDHAHAPRWTHATGDRMTAEGAASAARPLPLDGWLDDHLAVARRLIRYRDTTGLDHLADFPTICRDDLMADVAAFVPLDADLGRAVHGSSSGSTGAALVVPDDQEDNARTFHLLRALVAEQGVTWDPDPARLALAHVVNQRDAFTYVSLITGFAARPMVRINLDHAQWPSTPSRSLFLADADPQVVTGDPTSLEALLDDDLADAVRPLALFSGAMALAAPLRAALEDRFRCPVIDIYGLHETRPIAARADDGPFRILGHRIVVEVLGPDGGETPQGEVGEITVTVGQNPLLPLVRYRTGDFAELVTMPDGGLGLDRLEGRENTVFAAAGGSRVPCVDLTQHLQAHGARGWVVEQHEDLSVEAHIAGGDAEAIGKALARLLGAVPVTVTRVATVAELGHGKPRRYRCAVKMGVRGVA